MIRGHVVMAVFRRNFTGYFRSPTGYVFITVFLLLSAAMAFWPDAFFVKNLANLDVLNQYFPYLLLFFVPAVGMSTWAEERKQGTDELLLTLPARDLELVLGKYLAALGIYGTSLLFALMYVFILFFLGSPDIGLMLGTYLGYLFIGGALLSVAMFASLLTGSVTVAFILGALFCAIPVFLSKAGAVVPGERPAGWFESLGVQDPFGEFTSGVLSLQSVFYFAALTILMLYLNLVVLAKRHTERLEPWLHRAGRAVCLLVAAVSLGVLLGRLGWSFDVTQERLHSLSPATREVIKRLDPARPVYIHAYVSPEVPTEYVQTRTTLITLLKDIAAKAGPAVQLRIVDTERHSAEAREADEKGIKPQRPMRDRYSEDEEETEQDVEEIFMGVAMTCGGEEVVVPFLYRGVPVEYEVTRSLGTVSGLKRRRVGIAATDAKLFASLDFQTFRQQPEWLIVSELRKQYDVVEVHLDKPLTEKYDCLIVAMPSSLTQQEMDNLLAYLQQGNPALLCDDPFPYWQMEMNPSLSPDNPTKQGPGARNPMFGQPPGQPKGDLYRFMDGIGVQWNPNEFVGENWNPHPRLKHLPNEFVFVGPGAGNSECFNPKDAISSRLQEMVFVFPGRIQKRTDLTDLTFTPLVSTSRQSNFLLRPQVLSGFQFNPRRIYMPGGQELCIAARVEGKVPAPRPTSGTPPPAEAKGGTIKLVYVADLDFIDNNIFGLHRRRLEGLEFDNVTFILNCVDSLAGDDSVIELRKRRPKHRTLTRVEEQTETYVKKEAEQTKEAEDEAKKAIDAADKAMQDKVKELNERSDIDLTRKLIEVKMVQEAENRRFQAKKKEIEDKKEAAIERGRTEKEQAVKEIRKRMKIMAVLLPPIPAALIALILAVQRLFGSRRPS